MNKIAVTIVFNGKEMTTAIESASIKSLSQAQTKVNEAIETFIQRYKLPEVLAEKVRKDSYWNQADFKIEDEKERYSQTHSELAYRQLQNYLSETGQTQEQALRLAKEWIADYYQLILGLEHEGYSRVQAQKIMEDSPRYKERQRWLTVILGEHGLDSEWQKIGVLKGFYY